METNQTSLFNQSGPGRYEPTYFNTTNLDSEETQKWEDIIVGENAKVLGFFANHPHAAFNAWDVSDNTGIFITNCRRAINTLVRSFWLVQVGENIGKKGHKNFTYKYQPKGK